MPRRSPPSTLFPYTTLFRSLPDFTFSVSHTTRKPRASERDGREYHFVDRARFEALIDSDRKSTRLNSSHLVISYAVSCLKKKQRPRPYSRVLATHHPDARVP